MLRVVFWVLRLKGIAGWLWLEFQHTIMGTGLVGAAEASHS